MRVVDDLETGFAPTGTGWHGSTGGYLGHHRWLPARAAQARHSATWKATLDAPGQYRVSVMIPRRNATTRSATYRIRTTDGTVRRTVNQWRRRGDWVSLGVHDLPIDAVVRLSDRTGERGSLGRRVTFDAVRFVPIAAVAGEGGPSEAGGDPRNPDEADPARGEHEPESSAAVQPEPSRDPEPSRQPEATPDAEPSADPEVAPAPEAEPSRDPARSRDHEPEKGPEAGPTPEPERSPEPEPDRVAAPEERAEVQERAEAQDQPAASPSEEPAPAG